MRFKAEVNFDGREVARAHVNRLHLENVLRVCVDPNDHYLMYREIVGVV